MIPLQISIDEYNAPFDVWRIMEPDVHWDDMTVEEQIAYALSHKMVPTKVHTHSETYCRDADRTANYELEHITNVNYKSKAEFTWDYLKVEYAERLLNYLQLATNYKDPDGKIQPVQAPTIYVRYRDFTGMRTIKAYLGQTIEGDLVELVTQELVDNELTTVRTQYWESFRIAFPER